MKRASLNHVFRLIWSDAEQAFIAVAEHAAARGKRAGVVGFLAAAGALCSTAVLAAALPTGGAITSGSGSISQSGNQMVIDQQSGKLVTQWNSFDVGADASVTFHQPDANSIALNRVVGGGNASQILGKLDANGQVWLLNPNGVVIGKGAEVNVGGLVASSLQISDEDFLAGKTTLEGSSSAGAVINQGRVSTAPGGVVALIGPQVGNSGSLQTPGGSSVLAAGEKVSLDFQGDGLVAVNIERGALDAAVRNDGQISADGGLVSLSARSADALVSSVINNTGVIEAKGLVEREGRILLDGDDDGGLTQVSGTLDVSSEQGKGGSLVVTGETIGVSDARLDASGASGGGTVKIGGGWQGQDASVANATQVTVDADVSIKADATRNGDGGTVVAWSDGDNRFAGTLSVRGGDEGGDGGKAEVSGKQTLQYAGTTDARAAKGRTGDLLLDPTTITISGGSGTSGNWSSSSGAVTVYEETLEQQTANVLLQATDLITFGDLNLNGGDGTIRMQDGISFRAEVLHDNSPSSGYEGNMKFTNKQNTLIVSGTGSIYLQAGGYGTGSITNVFNLVAEGAGVNPAPADLPAHDTRTIGSGEPGAGTITLLGADGADLAGTITTNGGYVRISVNSDGGDVGDLLIDKGADITTNGGNLYLSFGATQLNGITPATATLMSDITLGQGRLFFGDAIPGGNTKNLGKSTGDKLLGGLLNLSGDVNFTTPLTMLGGASIYTDGAINFTSTVKLDTKDKVLTLRANNIDFTRATLSNLSTASLRLEPYNIATDITLDSSSGNTGGILLDSRAPATNISSLKGIRNLTIGRADGTGTTTIENSGFSFDANNNISLLNGSILIEGRLSNSNATGHVQAHAGVNDVTITKQGSVTATGSGDAIVLDAKRNFLNYAGAQALSASNAQGRWLTYSSTPSKDVRGDLAMAFKQYAATYGTTVQGSGNGHLYSTAPTVTVTLSGPVRKTYNGNANATVTLDNLSVSGAIDGDSIDGLSFGKANYDNKDAGEDKTVTVNNVKVSSASNREQGDIDVYGYQVASSTVSADVGQIDRKTLTASGTAKSKTYNGSTSAELSDLTLSGVLDAEKTGVTLSGSTGSFTDKNVGEDKSVNGSGLSISGSNASNYEFDTKAEVGKADITAKALTATATVDDKTYDGTKTAKLSKIQLSGVLAADEDKVIAADTTGTFASKNVGTDISVSGSGIALTGTEAGNYTIDTTAKVGEADITTKTLTAKATVDEKTYDGTTTAKLSAVTLEGVAATDAGKVSVSGTTGTFASKNVGTDISVSGSGLTISGDEVANYTFDTDAKVGQADITPKTLTAEATAKSKTYDGSTSAELSSLKLVGVLEAEKDGVTLSGNSGSFNNKNVGKDKSVNGSGLSISGDNASNYQFDTKAEVGKAEITTKTLTAKATVNDKTYDGNTTAKLSAVTLEGVAATDAGKVSVSGTTGTFASKNVGTDISVSGSGLTISGDEVANYTFDTDADVGKADITPKTLTAEATAKSKTYDGSTSAELSSLKLVGVLEAEKDGVTLSGNSGSFTDKNVGKDKSVNGSGLSISGNNASNYQFDTKAEVGKADITTKTLTAKATVDEKTYDGTTTAKLSAVTLEGVAATDAGKVSVSGTTGTFASKNVGTDISVSGSGLTISGDEVANYTFDTDAKVGQADITPKTLTAKATVNDKTYDGNTTAKLSNVALVGVVTADAGKVSAKGTSGSFSDKNAGEDKTVNGSGITLSGDESGNYTFDTTAKIGTADIDRKVVTATAEIADKRFDGRDIATLSQITLKGILEGESVDATAQARFDSPIAGRDKTVEVSDLQLTGADAANYQLAETHIRSVATIEQPLSSPVGLINAPEGANGTGTAVKRPDDQAIRVDPASLQPSPPASAYSQASVLPPRPDALASNNTLVLQDAILSGNGETSLAIAGSDPEPVVRMNMDIYRDLDGAPLHSEGQYVATDLGNSISLKPMDAADHQPPELKSSGAMSADGAVEMANGEQLKLRVTAMDEGVLLVQVTSQGANLESSELAAYGLSVAKKRLGISVNSIEAVVVEPTLSHAEATPKARDGVVAR